MAAFQHGGERLVPIPWILSHEGDDDDGDEQEEEDEESAETAVAMLDTEGQRLYSSVQAFFPPNVAISPVYLADMVRARRCTQCGQGYREIHNYRLSCLAGTHVMGVNDTLYTSPQDIRPLWECCLRPSTARTRGCVAADHTDDPRMRRLRPQEELYNPFPACMWFSVERDNRSVLMSADAGAGPAGPTDDDVRRVMAEDPSAGELGAVPAIVLMRYDWRTAIRLRDAAEGRRLQRYQRTWPS